MSIKQAAEEIGVHRDTLRRWINQGLVKVEPRPTAIPNAKKWRYRIPKTEVDRLRVRQDD